MVVPRGNVLRMMSKTSPNGFGSPAWMLSIMASVLTLSGVATQAKEADGWSIDATNAYAVLQEQADEILFVDVRDPIEIQFVGSTDVIDINIPFLKADPTRWNAEKGTFLMHRNAEFAQQVRDALRAKGLDEQAVIYTMCRSGSDRGKPSAAFLRENGFPSARYIRHGFQGDRLEEGPNQGRRLKNGWQNEGLPWSPRMNPDKIHRPQEPVDRQWLVILSSDSTQTQAMSLILARAKASQGTFIRILLCDEAGLLAVADSEAGSAKVQPLDQSPRDLLAVLIEQGATVELCGIFARTKGIDPSRFIGGVTVASPRDVARQISDPTTRVLSF